MSSLYSCPICYSEDTKRVSLVFASGINSSTSVSTVAFGVGGHAGLASSAGISQSINLLSATLHPPVEKRTVLRLLVCASFVLVAILALINLLDIGQSNEVALSALLVCAIGIAIYLGISILERMKFNRDHLPALIRTWQAEFICLRCANRFLPTR